MFNATGVLARGLAAVHGTEAEQKLAALLYDDNIQVISSLELNQIASYTYHETSIAGGKDLCEKILDMLEAVLSKPVDHSTLTMQKSLVVFKHILIYGAEKVINASTYLGAYVEQLQNYNTAVMAQQGSLGMLMRFKGGAVDKGGPVRELAQQLLVFITNRHQLQFERSTKADPNSLVPVGSRDRAAFVTDEARLHALKKRMERERLMMTQSNLAKSNSAFGSGYTGRDGKAVVGAAHGLDEMIKQARKEKQKFSDEGYRPPGSEDALAAAQAQAEANLLDLLAMKEAATVTQSVDLLDFGGPSNTETNTTQAYETDLLGGWGAPAAAPASAGNDIFGSMAAPAPAASHDPFAFAAAPAPASSDFAGLGVTTTTPVLSTMQASSKPPMAEPEEDRFAALDALAGSSTQSQPSLGGYSVGAPTPDVNKLTDLSVLSISSAPASVPAVNTSAIRVSQMGSAPVGGEDDDDNGFVMGGTTGAGLMPLGPAPATPPPPPPPGGW
uniref:ENTH domain-containing protein n=1 Tax=Amphora coffeiformis TaxID=265554 RepID=A0A7S3L761_9STRA|mmetsp:Transcript_24128/g.45900  ORF Transcript_24128/g.45900 Transcript_24128/m.45900 type:complete len:500 (+) Transcript_24128:94-1593(+)